jgi:hypothetical protein
MTTAKEGTTNYGEFPKDKQAEHAEKQPRFKDGHSLAWYAKQPIDPAQTLLGNRYLCRTGGMFIAAPSGMGKSTLSLQMAVLWCCGLVAFGVKPSKALRILIVQSEDDQGDCTEMTQVINHLKLSGEQKLLVEEKTKLIRCNDLVGYRLIQALEAELMQANGECKPFDLVIINPYGVFLGADAKDVDACTQFLNTWINPLLSKFAIGVILIHHTPKTNFRDTTDWKPSDWMYSGAGASVMTNWARAYLAIDPCGSHDVYKFIAAKRGKRIGWGNRVPVYETFWAHSREDNQLLWLPADSDQIATAKTASKPTPDDVLALIPLVDPISQELLLLHAHEKLNGIGINKVKSFVKILIDEEKIVEKKLPRPGTKSAKGYVRAN